MMLKIDARELIENINTCKICHITYIEFDMSYLLFSLIYFYNSVNESTQLFHLSFDFPTSLFKEERLLLHS